MARGWSVCAAAIATAALAGAALAALPEPIVRQDLFPFPGAVTHPASARSAGLALADRWLGEEPFENPAAAPARSVSLTPVITRVSRQDLRARFHDLEETAVFVDGGGARVSLPAGRMTASLYAWQPVLRHEEDAYTRGTVGAPTPPATVAQSLDMRESRVGLALSFGMSAMRLGVAGEYWRRDDDAIFTESSGVPQTGTREAKLTGSGGAVRAGARRAFGVAGRPLDVGLGAGYVMPADIDVATTAYDVPGDTTARREGWWEGGMSARYAVTEAFAVHAGVGGAAAHDWGALDVTTGGNAMWAVAVAFHDVRDPWSARAGVGQEMTRGAAEPRAGAVGLGLGWLFEGFTIDVGALRRTITRPGSPHSQDDRIAVTATVPL